MTPNYRDTIVNTIGVVGYWRLSDTSGTTALATVGPNGTYANTPTLGALGTISGEPNKAVSFDRVSLENVSIPTGIPAGTSRGISMSCLIRPNGDWAVGGDHTLFNWGWVNNPALGAAFFEWTQGTGSFLYYYNDGALRANVAAAFPLTAGQTYHIVNSHDYVLKKHMLYVNGALIATNDFSAHGTPNVIAANAPSYIGSYDGTNYNWAGVIDEMAIFNRPLTAGEAAHLARLARGF